MDAQPETQQQEVHVYLKLSDDGFGEFEEREGVFALEDKLDEILSASGAGACDGHEFGQGYAIIFAYGSDADKMCDLIVASIKSVNPRAGSYIIKQCDELGEREERIDL